MPTHWPIHWPTYWKVPRRLAARLFASGLLTIACVLATWCAPSKAAQGLSEDGGREQALSGQAIEKIALWDTKTGPSGDVRTLAGPRLALMGGVST